MTQDWDVEPGRDFYDRWFPNWVWSMFEELRDEFASRYPTLKTEASVELNLEEVVWDVVNHALEYRSQFWDEISDRFFSARSKE